MDYVLNLLRNHLAMLKRSQESLRYAYEHCEHPVSKELAEFVEDFDTMDKMLRTRIEAVERAIEVLNRDNQEKGGG